MLVSIIDQVLNWDIPKLSLHVSIHLQKVPKSLFTSQITHRFVFVEEWTGQILNTNYLIIKNVNSTDSW